MMRAAALLPALTGNVGRPGAGFYYLNYTPLFAGIDLGWLGGERVAPRANARPSATWTWHPGWPPATSSRRSDLVEHQPTRVRPASGRACAPPSYAGRSLHCSAGLLHDRHRASCRLRTSGRELSRVRRPDVQLLPSGHRRTDRRSWSRSARASRTRRSSAASHAPWV